MIRIFVEHMYDIPHNSNHEGNINEEGNIESRDTKDLRRSTS